MTSKLDRLLDELAGAADGKRHLPVVRAHEAEAICGMFQAQVDRGTEARAKAAAAAGRAIACAAGCAACCHNIPGIHAGEALVIARWLARPEHDAIRDAFLERFEAWRAAVGDLVDEWIAASARGDAQAGAEISQRAFDRQVACAFLGDGGRCTIYEVRPILCREHHAVGTPDACQPGSTATVVQAKFPPLDGYIDKIQPILLAMHDALKLDDANAKPIPQAVHDVLAALVGE